MAKEVHQYVKDFGQAARRAKMAGFDAVQVYGTHGYPVMTIGDAVSARKVTNAIHEAFQAAMSI